jgi:hypothetical protein
MTLGATYSLDGRFVIELSYDGKVDSTLIDVGIVKVGFDIWIYKKWSVEVQDF